MAETFELGDQSFAILDWPAARRKACGPLSPAERAVLDLLLAGLSNAEIARRRGRATRTIANQAASIFRRLGVGSRLQLFALFTESGSSPKQSAS